MKNIVVLLLAGMILSACNQKEGIPDKSELEKQEGIVASKREGSAGRPNDQILLIPNISAKDIANKTERELVAIAQEKNGAYYGISTDEYDEIDIGTHMTVYWDNTQEDSDPPQRVASIIEKVSE